MYAVAVIAFVTLGALLYSQLATTFFDVAAAYRQQSRIASLIRIADGLERYSSEVGGLPVSLDALVTTPGFEDLRGSIDPSQAYVLSEPLNDGTWIFQRAIAVSRDVSADVDHATYLAFNRCGLGDASTALAWCGSPEGAWFRKESRENQAAQLTVQRGRHHRMLHKWAAYFSVHQRFPGVDLAGDPLASGSLTELRELAGFAGDANSCTGSFTYAGIPVDCGEMFDQWGNPVGYQFIGPGHIVIVAEAPFLAADGTRPLIATDFEVTP